RRRRAPVAPPRLSRHAAARPAAASDPRPGARRHAPAERRRRPVPSGRPQQRGWLDLVLCNYIHNYSVHMNALIYWGSKDGYRPDRRTQLPTLLADGVAAADFNRDGFVDLAFSNRGIEGGERFGFDQHLESYIYWNGPTGFSEARRSALPTISAID